LVLSSSGITFQPTSIEEAGSRTLATEPKPMIQVLISLVPALNGFAHP